MTSAPDEGQSVSVVVADDQTVVREGLRAMLGFLPGIVVVATAASAEEALDLVARHDPDVLLTDLRMPGIGGVEGIRRLRDSGARTRAVALTTYDDGDTIRAALGAGALGFLNKDSDPATLATAIQAAAAGRSLLDARVIDAVVRGAPAQAPLADRGNTEDFSTARADVPGQAARHPDGLTEREVDVLRLIASGLANGQIARELYVSLSTVKTHVNHLFAKTGCTSRADLVRYAYDHALTPGPCGEHSPRR